MWGNGWRKSIGIALQLPVILVVGVKLGCINHALLTAQAIINDGLELAGWVANVVDPSCARLAENLATLQQLMPAPCLAEVPHLTSASAEHVAEYVKQAQQSLSVK